ncbi:hypothetical protein QBC44DRAFT_397404 [Cladorrhinum sp. PSN332]|nr:hypothetical protein QBC44DRAFT_397404 [Cladorrhinum sp. PSN332]
MMITQCLLFMHFLLLAQAQEQARSTVSIVGAIKPLGGHKCLEHCLWGSLWNMGWAMSCASPTLNNCYCATSSGAEATASNWISSCATENCAAGDRTGDISSMQSIYAQYCINAGLTQSGATKWFDPSKQTSMDPTTTTTPLQKTILDTGHGFSFPPTGTSPEVQTTPRAEFNGPAGNYPQQGDTEESNLLRPVALGLGLGLGIPLILVLIAIFGLLACRRGGDERGSSATTKPSAVELRQSENQGQHEPQHMSQQIPAGSAEPVPAGHAAYQPNMGPAQVEIGGVGVRPELENGTPPPRY